MHFDFHQISLMDWSLVAASALCSSVFYYCWASGLKHISANISALFVGIMPISTLLFASIFLHEHLTLMDSLGFSLVVVSLLLGTKQKALAPILHST